MKRFEVGDRVKYQINIHDCALGTVIEIGNLYGDDYVCVEFDKNLDVMRHVPPSWFTKLKPKKRRREIWIHPRSVDECIKNGEKMDVFVSVENRSAGWVKFREAIEK